MLKTIENAGCLVLGGGVAGSAAAWALAKRGEKVLLVDRYAPGHNHGSSHGDGRIFRFSYPEAVYLEMMRQARDGWHELERLRGVQLLNATGNWDCGPIGHPELDALEANIHAGGFPCKRLSAAESNARFPQMHLPPESEALYQPDGGVVFADQAVAAQWEAAQAAGARAVTNEPIAGIEVGDAGVELVAGGGRRYRAPRLVIAAGGWSGGLLASLDLHLPLEVSREQVAYFPERGDGVDHAVGKMPTVIDYHTDDMVYGLPKIAVPGFKLGWHRHGRRIESPEEPSEIDAENLAFLKDYVRRRLPHLSPEPITVITCLYTLTPDYHFVLDRHPRESAVTIGAGLSGHGFKFGPALGEILATLALGEEPPVEVGMFAISRFKSEGLGA